MFNYPVTISFDEHRMDGAKDDLFLHTGATYANYRIANPEVTWIHAGDTYDLARAEENKIKDAWGWLSKFEENDIFLTGNHDYALAGPLCPSKEIRENIVINGYLVEHGHRLFQATDTWQECYLLNALLYIHRKTNRRWQWVENKIEALLQTHRDNEQVYSRYEAEGTLKACFGHTHIAGNQGDYWTPGALYSTGCVLIFDGPDSGPRMEKII